MSPVSPVLPSAVTQHREVVIAKDQPEYIPLPSVISRDGGTVTTRWCLSWKERIRVFFGGHIYLHVMTFGRALQPVKLQTKEPTAEEAGW